MRLRIVGSGEAFDERFGNNSCLLQGSGIPTILFDCGYQIPERLWRIPGYRELDGVYFTHLHLDHSFGIAPLLTRFCEEKRRRRLRLVGPRGLSTFVERLMNQGVPGLWKKLPFQVDFVELAAGDVMGWGKLRFKTARSIHSVLNLAVRVDGPGGRSFGISGDGDMTPQTKALFADVGFLLHEVYSLAPGIPVHANLRDFSRFVADSEVGAVGVTHLSRHERRKIEQAVSRMARLDPRWFILKPGMEIRLR